MIAISNWQEATVFVIVALAVIYLSRRFVKQRRKSGCSSGSCSCEAKKLASAAERAATS